MRISDWSSDVCSSDLVEGDRSEIGRTENLARVVRYNPRDIHLQLADTPTIEEVDEAMVKLRNEHQHTLPRAISPEFPLHGEFGRQLAKIRSQRRFVCRRQVENDAHEEARSRSAEHTSALQ